MLVLDLLQAALNTAGECPDPAICRSTAFTAIGAAFTTEGYYVQADLIDYLTTSAFGLWAPLLYMLAALGGFIGMAMGQPPRTYLWFFIGPALYAWLLDTREPVHGVGWKIAGVPQNQKEVWKLAETGLLNTNYVEKRGYAVHADKAPTGGGGGGGGEAFVALPFIWFDELVSSTVQWMVHWSGVYKQKEGSGTTNIAEHGGTISKAQDKWYLLSNLKWSLLESITGAKAHSPDLRDAFISFLASECGDELAKMVNDRALVSSSRNRSGKLADTMFAGGVSAGGSSCPSNTYDDGLSILQSIYVPIPPSLRSLAYGVPGASSGAFWLFLPSGTQTKFDDHFVNYDNISCADYLYVIVQGFRWESGHVYHQLMSVTPNDMEPEHVVYNMFYGWGLRDDSGGAGGSGTLLTVDQQKLFTQDLILVHLFRNEMKFAPKLADQRYSASGAEMESYVESYQRTTGSKTKYGEVYTWALMVPYIQGIVLYLLAIGYPFACILIVVPGWHKVILTWASFWAWAKLWDLGFAIVMVLERSIWAMLGNNTAAQSLASRIYCMQTKATIDVACPSAPGGTTPDHALDCAVADVTSNTPSGGSELQELAFVFDQAMLLGTSLDLDLANAYYIYIMAALYFAVPAVTGQMVLGARAGAASMVGNFTSSAQQDASRGVSGGYLGKETMGLNAIGAATEYGYTAQALRHQPDKNTPSLMSQSIMAGNQASRESMAAGAAQTISSGIGEMNSNRVLGFQQFEGAMSVATGTLKVGTAALEDSNRRSGGVPAATRSSSSGPSSLGESQVGQQGEDTHGGGVVGQVEEGGASSPPAPSVSSGGSGALGPGLQAFTGPDGKRRTIGGALGQLTNKIVDAAKDPVGTARRAPGAGLNAARNNTGLIDSSVGLAASAGYHDYKSSVMGDSALANAEQADLGIAGFGHNQASSLQNEHGRRLGGYADYAARTQAWGRRNRWAMSIAGASGAMGIFAGTGAPGSKPIQADAMAYEGMLGASAKSAARAYDPNEGSMWHGSGGYHDQMSAVGQYDGMRVRQMYQSWNPRSAMAYSVAASGRLVANWGTTGGDGGGQGIYSNNSHRGEMGLSQSKGSVQSQVDRTPAGNNPGADQDNRGPSRAENDQAKVTR